MKILVTGASGFLGRRLTRELVAGGHEVTALGRTLPEPVEPFGGAELVVGDITDQASLERVRRGMPGPEAIVHLAGLVPRSRDEDLPGAMAGVNVGGTVNLLEVFGPVVTRFVYASTAEVYGLPQVPGPISEGTPPDPPSYYAASKLAAEVFCEVYGKRHSLPVAVLRLSVLYGPGDRINRAIPNFVRSALSGRNLQVHGGEELRDYLYVDDAAEALRLAVLGKAPGTFNIGSGRATSIREVAQAVIERIGGDLSVEVLPRTKVASDIVMDITRAQADLGFRPRYFFPDMLDEQMACPEPG
ncbi:MAG: NAD(P)-dependent oxidoreductase [Actinomycetota bacterium]|nr:NAD(P)-dependent oxidoreductase [Actinomycetota bacterium]